VLLDWTEDKGLELGARADLHWESKLSIGGRVGGEFFRSATIESPPYIMTVPIGAVPVPVTLTASAMITCVALTSGPSAVAVTIAADAKVGGSFYVKSSLTTSPDSWVTPGTWTPEMSGSASVTPDLEDAPGITIQCALPRIEFKALVAGVAGVFLAATPLVTVAGPSPGIEGILTGGVRGKLFTREVGTEVRLLTWKP
jgi:hypothetical protein